MADNLPESIVCLGHTLTRLPNGYAYEEKGIVSIEVWYYEEGYISRIETPSFQLQDLKPRKLYEAVGCLEEKVRAYYHLEMRLKAWVMTHPIPLMTLAKRETEEEDFDLTSK